MIFVTEQDHQKEVLAGNSGQCTDYKHATDFGHDREPFTWLSSDAGEEVNRALASRLQQFKLSRKTVGFEAWEFDNDKWDMVFGGDVLVLYVEVDARLPKVRALLQWAPNTQPNRFPDTQDSPSL